MHRFALPALCLALSACQPIPQEAPYPGSPGPVDLVKCGGDLVEPLIGQSVTNLPASGNWGTLRVIRPGQAVTEDYSETRLNVQLDEADTIIALSCG